MKGLALHHLHSKKHKTNLLNITTIIVSILLPLATLPQLYDVYISKHVQDLSLLTWVLWAVLTFPLLLYSIKHKAKPLILLYSLWLVVHILMIIGIAIYR